MASAAIYVLSFIASLFYVTGAAAAITPAPLVPYNGTLPNYGSRYVISAQTRCLGNGIYFGTYTSPNDCEAACRAAGAGCIGFNLNIDTTNPRDYGECGVWGDTCIPLDAETHAWYKVSSSNASPPTNYGSTNPPFPNIQDVEQSTETVLERIYEAIGDVYVASPGRTCYGYTSGSLLGHFSSPIECARLCSQRGPNYCRGFNLNLNEYDTKRFGWCTVWANDRCYCGQAKGHVMFRPSVGVTPSNNTDPPDSVPGFARVNGVVCSGGTSYRLNDWSAIITRCAKDCEDDSEHCGGINFNRRTGQCIVRSRTCVPYSDANFVFFQLGTSAVIIQPTITPIQTTFMTLEELIFTTRQTMRTESHSISELSNTFPPDIDHTPEQWTIESTIFTTLPTSTNLTNFETSTISTSQTSPPSTTLDENYSKLFTTEPPTKITETSPQQIQTSAKVDYTSEDKPLTNAWMIFTTMPTPIWMVPYTTVVEIESVTIADEITGDNDVPMIWG